MAYKDYKNTRNQKKSKTKSNSGFLKFMLFCFFIIIVILLFTIIKTKTRTINNSNPVMPETTAIKPNVKNNDNNKKANNPTLPPMSYEELNYIKELENRRIDGSQQVNLTTEQKKALKEFNQTTKKFIEPNDTNTKKTTIIQNKPEVYNKIKVPSNNVENSKTVSNNVENSKTVGNNVENRKTVGNNVKNNTVVINNVDSSSNNNNTKDRDINNVANNSKNKQDGSQRKYGLQCGSFSNQDSANKQANTISALGHVAFIKESGQYYRVLIGPLGDQPTAQEAKQKISSAVECIVIAM